MIDKARLEFNRIASENDNYKITNSAILFHFSGLSSQIIDDNGDEVDGLDEILLPVETNPKNPNAAIRDDEIENRLNELRIYTYNILCIYDTNFEIDRSKIGRGIKLETKELSNRTNESDPFVIEVSGVSTISAGKISLEIRKESLDGKYTGVTKIKSNGALTYYLVKAFWDAEPQTTYREIFQTIVANLRSITPNLQPEFVGDADMIMLGGAALWERFGSIVNYYNKKISENPQDFESVIFLSEIYRIHKRYSQGQKLLEQQLKVKMAPLAKRALKVAYADINFDWGESLFIERLYNESLSHYQKAADTYLEYNLATANLSLLKVGQIYSQLNSSEKAIENYKLALNAARNSTYIGGEGDALSGLMGIYEQIGKSDTAILYGKQAINKYQQIRTLLKKSDKDVQKEFIKSKETIYRNLANLLVAEGRFPEAQAVLDLLKDEEYKQLARSGENLLILFLITKLKMKSSPKSKISSRSNANAPNCKNFSRQTANFPLEQNKKLEQLNLDIAAANKAFDAALDALGKAEKSAETRVDEIKGGKVLQSALTELSEKTNSGVVALYTVLGTEEEKDASGKPVKDKQKSKFGWVIMVTENRYTAYPIDVANLEENVFDFRTALSSDKYDPQPLAEKIYTAIFRQTSPNSKKRSNRICGNT